MCEQTLTLDDGTEISCRKCNECVSTRINTWIARAMAEKALWPFTYVAHLTYANESREDRNGAESFRYSDVRAFFARLRRQIEHKTGETGSLRFIVAGERGSDRGRVHWHVVLFSGFDVLDLGEWRKYGRKYEGPKVSEKGDNRLNWSLWPHGFASFQEPDQGGMSYALKYALKDQFSVAKSQGTMRHHKAENYASSYFRMSKAPPIGHPWLWSRLKKSLENGHFPVSLNQKVPGYSGFWYPSGELRLDILRYLRDYAQDYEAEHKVRPAQEGALLGTLSDPDLEVYYGEEEDEFCEDEFRERARIAALERRESAERSEARSIRANCGGLRPCELCRRGLSQAACRQADWEAENYRLAEERAKCRPVSYAEADAIYRRRYGQANPYCVRSDEDRTRSAFKGTARRT